MSDINHRRDGKHHHKNAIYGDRAISHAKHAARRERRNFEKFEIPVSYDDALDADLSPKHEHWPCLRSGKARDGAKRKEWREEKAAYARARRAEAKKNNPAGVTYLKICRQSKFDWDLSTIDSVTSAELDTMLQNAKEVHIRSKKSIRVWRKSGMSDISMDAVKSYVRWFLQHRSIRRPNGFATVNIRLMFNNFSKPAPCAPYAADAPLDTKFDDYMKIVS